MISPNSKDNNKGPHRSPTYINIKNNKNYIFNNFESGSLSHLSSKYKENIHILVFGP